MEEIKDAELQKYLKNYQPQYQLIKNARYEKGCLKAEVSYSFSVLSNLKICYESADVDAKQKLIGSIFPEKLIFKNGTYRTTKESEILSLLCNSGIGLNGVGNKKIAKNPDQSNLVGPLGIEPSTY